MIKAASKHFTSVCYSADGTCVIAGGNTEFVCIYELSQKILVKKFVISSNRSEFNPVADVDMATEYGSSVHLPGAKRADDGTRKTGQEVITMQVSFSSTGREWAAVSNEGLLIYTLDDDMVFDPISMTEDITPKRVLSNLFEGKHAVALLISLHLNESTLVKQVIEGTPYDMIVHVVKVCFYFVRQIYDMYSVISQEKISNISFLIKHYLFVECDSRAFRQTDRIHITIHDGVTSCRVLHSMVLRNSEQSWCIHGET